VFSFYTKCEAAGSVEDDGSSQPVAKHDFASRQLPTAFRDVTSSSNVTDNSAVPPPQQRLDIE